MKNPPVSENGRVFKLAGEPVNSMQQGAGGLGGVRLTDETSLRRR